MPSSNIPKFAWKRRYDNVLADPGGPKRPPLDVLLSIIPMTMRMRSYEKSQRKAGHEPLEFMTAPTVSAKSTLITSCSRLRV